MRFILTANEAAGLYAYRLLKRSEHEVVGIVTPSSNVAMHRLANNDGVPVLRPSVLGKPDFVDWVTKKEVDVLLNVHLLEVIHPDILQALNVGGFNLHPGPLPEYAGLNAPGWAIYNDEKNYGVTLHWLTPTIDNGPIAYSSEFPIEADDTALLLSNRCTMEGMELVAKLLKELTVSEQGIPRVKQDPDKRTYYAKAAVPQQGMIDWRQSTDQIERFVRACNYGPFKSVWGFPVTIANEKEVEVLAVTITHEPHDLEPGTVGDVDDKGVKVATADEWLIINTCKVDGRIVPPQKVFRSNEKLSSLK